MATSKSDFWGGAYSQVNTNSSMRKRIARVMNLRMNRKDRKLMITLLGVVAGTTATDSFKRVAHVGSAADFSGKRTVETVYNVNRATTAADVTDLAAKILAYSSRPTTYPKDKARLGTLAVYA